ncbi:MAG: hypothetical protein SGPRY_001412 [Prymnesium sp.]
MICGRRGVHNVEVVVAGGLAGGAAYVLEAPALPPIVKISLPQLSSGVLGEVNLTRIGEQSCFSVPNNAGATVYCIVSSEGSTKVLTMAEHPLLSAQADLIEEHASVTAKYLISVESLGISLLDHKPQELLYLSCGGLQLELACSAAAVSLQASSQMEIGNGRIRLLLRANPRAHAKKPQFMIVSALYLRKHTSLHYLRHMSFFLQELDVALDWELFTPIAALVVRSLKQLEDARARTTSLLRSAEMMPTPPSPDPPPHLPPAEGSPFPFHASPPSAATGSVEGTEYLAEPTYDAPRPLPRKCYVEMLTLHPVVLNFTSSSSTGFAHLQRLGANAPLSHGHFLVGYVISALNALGVMLTSASRLCEQLNELLGRIGRHYFYQASQALLRIAGDLDLLGSPVALFGNLGSGVRDFFYEPANALIYSPRELHHAVAKGTLSLMRNTVFSTVNATSKVSGTLGKGLAALSMDDAFVRRRAARMAAQRPKTIAQVPPSLLLHSRGVYINAFIHLT